MKKPKKHDPITLTIPEFCEVLGMDENEFSLLLDLPIPTLIYYEETHGRRRWWLSMDQWSRAVLWNIQQISAFMKQIEGEGNSYLSDAFRQRLKFAIDTPVHGNLPREAYLAEILQVIFNQYPAFFSLYMSKSIDIKKKGRSYLRDQFLEMIHSSICSISTETNLSDRQKLELLAHSILVAIDGESQWLPPLSLCWIDGEGELGEDIGGDLHSEFYRIQKEGSSPETQPSEEPLP